MVCDRNMTSSWTRNERMIIDHQETSKPCQGEEGLGGNSIGVIVYFMILRFSQSVAVQGAGVVIVCREENAIQEGNSHI